MPGKPDARRHLGTRARAAVGWALAGWAVSQLALAVTLERWRPDLRDPEYGHKLRLLRRQTAIASDRPLLLALGSSRTLNGLRPDMLPPGGPRVFNFGLTRHGPVQQLLAFDRLLRDGVRPRWVTIELLPSALALGAGELDMVPAGQHTFGDVRFLRAQRFRPASYVVDWLGARAVPCYTNRFAVLSWLCPSWVPWAERADYVWTHTDPGGWLELPPLADPAAVRAHAAGDGAVMQAFHVHPDSDRAVRQLVTRCRTEGIEPALLLMPEAEWFRELYRGNSDTELRAYAARLARESRVPVIDARDWSADAGFRDGTHLIADGAARFTERFGREMAPLLTEPKNASAKRR